jgi:predicted DNA-binding transcriptional regulator YafY
LTFSANPTYEFKTIILGLGSDVRIMEPQDLKDEIISVLQETLEGYSSN